MNKKIAVIIAAVVLVAGIGGVAFARYHSVSDTPKEVVTTETEEVVNIDYLKYVKGLKDWTVEQNTTPNFMDSVEWDKAYISAVTCDSAEVDMDTVGTYEINYSVVPLRDNELKVSKTVKVEVVAPEKADELASQGKEVVTDEGIKNKAVAKASSMTDKGVAVKDKNNKKVEVKKDSKGNVTGTVTAKKPASKPSTSKPSVSKPTTGSSASTSKPSTPSKPQKPEEPAKPQKPAEPSKPSHTHNWVAVTTTINHPEEGHYVNTKVKDEWDEKIKDAWTETKKTPIYGTRYTCKGCGAVVTADGKIPHTEWHLDRGEDGHSFASKYVQVDTKVETINHPAEYKHHDAVYEKVWKIDKKAWTETETTGYKCSCGARK